MIHDLADSRLITTEGEKDRPEDSFVEVAHEALIRGWSKLRMWIDTDREALRIHRRLSDAASEWTKTGHDESYLYRGIRLAEAEEWILSNAQLMNSVEREFLQKSIDLRDREVSQEKSRQKKLRRRAFAATLAAGVAILAAGFALYAYFNAEKQSIIAIQQRDIAKAEKLRADEERLKSRNLLANNYWSNALDSKEKNNWLSLLHYSARAGELASNQTRAKNSIFNINNHVTIFLSYILNHGVYISGAVFAKEKNRILIWSTDFPARVSTVKLWDASDGSPIGQPMKHDNSV